MSIFNEETDADMELDAMRHRAIAQTEAFISEALLHPELAAVIPTIPVGSGTFPKNMALYFWHRVLGDF
jgi:hypothetical protein